MMFNLSFHPEDLIGVTNPIIVLFFVPLVLVIVLVISLIVLRRKK